MIFDLAAMALLLLASITDIRKKEVPVWEIAGFIGISLMRAAALFPEGDIDVTGLVLSVVPGIIVLLLAFVTRQGIGYGDGLVILALGPTLGLERMGLCLMVAFFACSVLSGILFLIKKAGKNSRIPFVPFITIGMGVSLIAAI